jgi:hypothetical protein
MKLNEELQQIREEAYFKFLKTKEFKQLQASVYAFARSGRKEKTFSVSGKNAGHFERWLKENSITIVDAQKYHITIKL